MELEQRQRIATRLIQQPLTYTRHRLRGGPIKERQRRVPIERLEDQLAKPRLRESAILPFARTEQDRDPFRHEPTPRERQSGRRGKIEPLRIIDETQNWSGLRCGGEQRQRASRHQKPVGSVPGDHAECRRERLPLRFRQQRQSRTHSAPG